MPECCLCDATCSFILFFIIVMLLFLILAVWPKQASVSMVNNQTNNPSPPPPDGTTTKKSCLDIIKALLCYGGILLVLVFLTCLYPIKITDYFIYDTSKENNDYVIGSLKVGKLQVLDKVLMIEKKECGERIARVRVKTMVNGDQAVIDAYDRWRDIKTFSRSYDHWIYPDEREIYIREYDLMWPRKKLVRTKRLLPFCRKLPWIK